MAFIQFLPHYIRIKGKGNRTFPVIAMEIEKSESVVGILKNKSPKIQAKPAEPGAIVFAGEEEEEIESLPESKIATAMDIYFCVGDSKSGEYLWVHSDNAIYVGTKKPMNKIKK